MGIISKAVVINNIGRRRGNNEDNFYLDGIYMPRDKVDNGGIFSNECNKNDLQVYAVCDGMGGTDAGEEAALCAVNMLDEFRKTCKKPISQKTVVDFLQCVSDRIYNESHAKGNKSGTTIVMVMCQDDSIALFHVGDSRIYRLRDGELKRMTTDHSEVQRMISMGAITEEEARHHPRRHVISQYLGMPSHEVLLSPGISNPVTAQPGDVYLLCSDGLTDMLEDRRIAEIMNSADDIKKVDEMLVQEALNNGGVDNVTAMLVRIEKSATRVSHKKRSLIAKIIIAAIAVDALWLLLLIADLLSLLF